MKIIFQGIGLLMKPDEVVSVGKYWLWMTVFSTCLFASCGETNRQSPEPVSPEPKTHATPARYDQDIIRGEAVEGKPQLISDELEEFPDSDFDDQDLEHFEDFEDDEIRPDILEEVR